MVKNNSLFFLIFTLLATFLSFSQEIKIFRVADFDLKGKVKSCLVITDYGKEEYYFDETGKLAKSVTRYNDSNYETTHYKYKGQDLMERRVENYRDNVFDSGTSFATFYDIDTLGTKRIVEKIVSYDKELMERNIYYFGQGERLTRIEQTDTEEINEHLFTYSLQDGDSLVTHELNGVLFKTKQIIKQSDSTPKTVIKQNFLEGVPVQKTVETFDVNNELLSLEKFTMDSAAQKWIPGPINSYTYTENGTLLSLKTETSTTTSLKEYIYQFDGTTANNWVKKIITPDNTYTTRRIAYYQVGENVQNSSN